MARTYLEPAEIAKLERVAKNPRDKLIIPLLFRLGCRISELLAIKTSDIDFDRGTVTIQHLKSRTKLACPRCVTALNKTSG